MICALGVGGFIAGTLSQLRSSLPSVEKLSTYQPQLGSEVYSTEIMPDGSEHHTLLARLYKENREWCPFQDIPVNLIHATVAIEDRSFFVHRGINLKGIVRAAYANLKAGRIRQGGSTITQQLVRAVWLSPKRTFARKVKEIALALQVERCFTKEEILEMYLNEVYYGHGAYGVKAAARLYFGKDLKDLDLAECAMLAGMPRGPSYYSPYSYPKRCRARRRQVLRAMAEVGYITHARAAAAEKEQIQGDLEPLHEQGFASFRAPYFTHMVVRQLCDQYGVKAVYQGGLRIYTTLDMRLQKEAEETMARGVERLRRRHVLKSKDLKGQGALVCMATQTGDVLAMVGGVGPFNKVQYNRAAPPDHGRQPGSAFKPYVWTAALDSGYGPDSVVSAAPISITDPTTGKVWSPRGGHGSYTLASALAHSINRVSVRLLLSVGADKVARYASSMMGISMSRLRQVPSLALGTSEVTPLEMAVGYTCIATGGLRPTPRFVREITDSQGNILVEQQPSFERVIPESTAATMIKLMHGVITHGTGHEARIDWPCAGKTGTTQEGRDIWFCGYTPDLTTTIWIGNDDHSPLGGDAYGGTYCAPLWAKFMSQAMKDYPTHVQFPTGADLVASKSQPAPVAQGKTVTLCTQSNELAGPYCPSTYEKTLAPGEPVPPPCHLHKAPPATGTAAATGGAAAAAAATGATGATATHNKAKSAGSKAGWTTVTICVDSGQLATPYCPHTIEKSFPPGKAPTVPCQIHGRGGRARAVAVGGKKAGATAAGKTGASAKRATRPAASSSEAPAAGSSGAAAKPRPSPKAKPKAAAASGAADSPADAND